MKDGLAQYLNEEMVPDFLGGPCKVSTEQMSGILWHAFGVGTPWFDCRICRLRTYSIYCYIFPPLSSRWAPALTPAQLEAQPVSLVEQVSQKYFSHCYLAKCNCVSSSSKSTSRLSFVLLPNMFVPSSGVRRISSGDFVRGVYNTLRILLRTPLVFQQPINYFSIYNRQPLSYFLVFARRLHFVVCASFVFAKCAMSMWAY